jgi:hypothetical protein
MEHTNETSNRAHRITGLRTAALLYVTRRMTEFFEATFALIGIMFFITVLTVNSSIWETLGCATQNSSKNKYTSKGSYFR